jgi:hypothetical protein
MHMICKFLLNPYAYIDVPGSQILQIMIGNYHYLKYLEFCAENEKGCLFAFCTTI